MKKIKMLMCICTSFLLIGAANVYAYSDSTFDKLEIHPAEGMYTVMTDTEGKIHRFNGVINTKKIEDYEFVDKIGSYEIFDGGVSVIKVTLNDIISNSKASLSGEDGTLINGYYKVDFQLSEQDKTRVFLTGLTDSNLNEVQEKLIAAKLENSQFSMESFDFIDAEKTNMPNDGDNELCWAAAASNIIHYTGWGKEAGFNSSDDLLDLFRDEFVDLPSNTYYGLEWFFNGTYMVQGFDGWAAVKSYGKSGKYYPEYPYESAVEYVDVYDNYKRINTVIDILKNGGGAGISLGWVDNNDNRNGGHAITAWGYIYDEDYTNNDKEYYMALIVSDSDSDQKEDLNRRKAPNKLSVLNLEPYKSGAYNSWRFDGYGNGVLEAFICLKARDDNTMKKETDGRATKDKFKNPDLTVKSVYTSSDPLDRTENRKVFSTEEKICIVPEIENNATVPLPLEEDILEYGITITNKNDREKTVKKTGKCQQSIAAYDVSDYENTEAIQFDPLETGDYEVNIKLNENGITEAYLCNNEYTYSIKVVNSQAESDAKINAQIGKINLGTADTALMYEGIDSLDIVKNHEVTYTLMQSYYEDGKWSVWSKTDTAIQPPAGRVKLMSSDTLPEYCRIYANGEKVKFRLIISTEDEGIPDVNIYSQEYPLTYTRVLIAENSGNNTTPLSQLDRGAKALKEGENIAFVLKDASTDPNAAEIQCTVNVYARQGETKTLLYGPVDKTIAKGTISDTIQFNSWDADLSGTYEIVAEASGEFGTSELVINSLSVKEKLSYEVNTSEDKEDPYDGKTSLREAVCNIQQYGTESDVITFADGIAVLYQQNPIEINGKVKIQGTYNEQTRCGTIILGQSKTQLFKVGAGGSLECDNINFNSASSKEYGGAVENQGGDVFIKNSIFIFCESGYMGGGIYSNGGSVKLLNCSFKENSSGYGGAIGTDGVAKLNMLNCNLFQNTSNGGAVYNQNSTAAIVYSTFTENTASSQGGGAVTSRGKGETNVFGSALTFSVSEENVDIDGNVNVYGSFVTSIANGAKADETTITDKGQKLFVCDNYTENRPSWGTTRQNGVVLYTTRVSPLALKGIMIKNADGNIAYSTDGEVWKETQAASVFTDDEYSHDALGKEHGGLFGSQTKVQDKAEIVGVYNNTAYIYAPEKVNDVVLIQKRVNIETNVMNGVRLYNTSLDMGTNAVTLESSADTEEECITQYMLWDGIDSMKPICKKY